MYSWQESTSQGRFASALFSFRRKLYVKIHSQILNECCPFTICFIGLLSGTRKWSTIHFYKSTMLYERFYRILPICWKSMDSADSLDIVQGLGGHLPWTQWTVWTPMSPWTKSSENSQTGKCPWIQWTLSMDSVDTVHGSCLWTLSMVWVDIVHGPSFQYSSRTMSTESMDFLQTETLDRELF